MDTNTIDIEIVRGGDDDPEWDYDCELIDDLVNTTMRNYKVKTYMNGILVNQERN